MLKYMLLALMSLTMIHAIGAYEEFYADLDGTPAYSGDANLNDNSAGLVKPCNGIIVQGYSDSVSYGVEPHRGVDIAGLKNTPLVSMGDGVIVNLFRSHRYGIAVEIKLDSGLELLYAHLENYEGESGRIREGQRIKAGERVGTMGTTGMSLGVHLHLEIRQNGKHIDPEPILMAIGNE